MDYAISVINLKKYFGPVKALEDVSFMLNLAKFLAFLGQMVPAKPLLSVV